MKIVILIFAAVLLAGSAFVGFIGANKARDEAHKVSEVTGKLSADQLAMIEKETGESVPSGGRLTAGSILGYLGGLAAAVLMVVAFANKQLVGKIGPVAIAVTALSALVYPYVHTGPMSGMAPRPQGLVAAALALVGFGLAMLAARKKA
jgi:hypothetical protein